MSGSEGENSRPRSELNKVGMRGILSKIESSAAATLLAVFFVSALVQAILDKQSITTKM